PASSCSGSFQSWPRSVGSACRNSRASKSSRCIGTSSTRSGLSCSLSCTSSDVEDEEMTKIEVLAPTAWPIVLPFGCTLLFAGLVTSASVSALGAMLAVAGSVGWFQDVFPHERETAVPIVADDVRVVTDRRVVERLSVTPDQLRAWLPVHTYPVSAGVKGGLAGGIA